jgi:hypothetical protein
LRLSITDSSARSSFIRGKDDTAALAQAQSAALSHFEPQLVSTFVNSPKNQGERCIEPIGGDQPATS